ncbi:putative transcriptional regulator, LuxR family protein [Sphaerisporangium melleum]|uniref:Transcriptional regulator, LuxR family protein n=1 Tax=Sphaerisporangium melleum TaxID=321316 RepID=A0A917VFR8_9ACTN|nr:LuxR family transcriptional regulator [Sphaerisporangium melleum]GGK71619.1 putative transcriptional regulator, LuxR family protein [Sphaerisporangium melleum]GII70148.1 putative transcriptional regulator, LuxR family protein [Sphaerisporangium melleum]
MLPDFRKTQLFGRRYECEVLDRLLGKVRAGGCGTLVIRAEPGNGKSALLGYAADQATGFQQARTGGVEPEMELAFAGLQQLCVPMLGLLDRLPGRQREALQVAFGLSEGPTPDRFLIGLGLLTLLSEAATERPLICLIDDASWLDRASLLCLAFVARRLMAEQIALLFAVRDQATARDQDAMRDLAGLPELRVKGIPDSDARMLLDTVIPGKVDERVRDRIVSEARGNPLALLELPNAMTSEELAGGFGLPDSRPVPRRVEQSYRRRLEALPDDTRLLLLAAAADPLGDVPLLWRTAERLGIGPAAATPAEAAQLVEIGTRVRFRHPLVRSAVYGAAPLSERQRVHRAIADSIDATASPDRRACHLGKAVSGPDEAVAHELACSAERAKARGGVAAAAAFLQRATELTPDPKDRGARALAAAQAKFEAAALDTAYELLAIADTCPLDDLQRARLERLRGQLAFLRDRGRDAPPLLLAAAARLAPLDAVLARDTYLEAVLAARYVGDVEGVLTATARAARAAPPPPDPPRPADLMLDGVVTRLTEGYVPAVPLLHKALRGYGEELRDLTPDSLMCTLAAMDLWEDRAWEELAHTQVQLAREAGMLSLLPTTLDFLAEFYLQSGDVPECQALLDEATAPTSRYDRLPPILAPIMLLAWQGDEVGTMRLIDDVIQDAIARGERVAAVLGEYAKAVLNNGLTRYDEALAAARNAGDDKEPVVSSWSLPELIEAAAHSGRPEAGLPALERLTRCARAGGTDWALGMEARSRALLSEGPQAETHYREAVERLGRTRMSAQLARTRLNFGEWLRRENDRRAAREQLRRAYETFTEMGARGFAERARRELLATGETVSVPATAVENRLTAQEAQIARMAASGDSNPEIAARLFISPRTVEWHLRKVFTKLDITSRRQLRRALPPHAVVPA